MKQHKLHRSSKIKKCSSKSPSLSNPVKTIDRYIPERKNLTKTVMCFCGSIQFGSKINQFKEFLSNKFSNLNSYNTIDNNSEDEPILEPEREQQQHNCAICMESKQFVVKTPTCEHFHCFDCFLQIAEKQHTISEFKCSFCRKVIQNAQVIPHNFNLQDQINTILSRKNKRELRFRDENARRIMYQDDFLVDLYIRRLNSQN